MEQTPSPGRLPQPLRSLRRHLRLALAAALLVTLAGIPVAWIKGRSEYSAEAVFQVFPSFQKNVSPDKELELQSNSQYREFVNHLSRSVLRYDVVNTALARMRSKGFSPCLPSETDRRCVERLQRAVYVLAVNDTYMVRVGLRSIDRNEPDRVVNAIMEVFLETTRGEQIFGSEDRGRMIVERRQQLADEVAALGARRDEMAARLGLTSFGENTTNPYDALLAQAREKLTLASIDRSQAQAALAAFGANREAPIFAGRSLLDMRLQDNGLQALRNEVVKRSEELGRTTAGLEDRHPARAPALAEQQQIGQRLARSEVEFDQMARQNVRARLEATLMQARQVEAEALERVRQIEGRAGAFATLFRDAMRVTADIRKREQELNELRDRQNFLDSERKAIGFVRLVTGALPADRPDGVGRLKLLALVLLAAAAAGVLLPTVIDLLDRRVIAPRDAEGAMGIGAAAWIVRADDAASRTIAADQVRRLASTLLRQCRKGSGRAFGFTSARVGGGTTALLHDLAATLAQLGSRVLLVDANTLRNRAEGEGPADVPCLAQLLDGALSAQEVIGSLRHEGTDFAFVPCGPAPEAGIQRLDLLRAALAQWSADWDIVLVDLPPLLPSADAELLADLVGQVFLVVEAGNVPKADVVRARAALQRLDPEAAGLVVTRVDAEGTGAAAQAHAVERITGGRFDQVMTLPWVALQWELLRARVARRG